MILNIGCYMTLCIAKKKSRKCILKIMCNINKIYSLFFHHSYIMHWKYQTYRVPMSVYFCLHFLTLWRILRTLSCRVLLSMQQRVCILNSAVNTNLHTDYVTLYSFLNIITGEMCWEYRTNRNTLWKNRNIVWNQRVKKASLSFCNR